MAGLGIFPGELWELLLDQLDDSKDVQSVLIASPALDKLFQKKKSNWLIDQVFPYIYDQLNFNFKNTPRHHEQEILSLRLVSRRWCKAIDKFFQDHPSRRPYKSNQSRRSLPYPSFVYRDIKKFPSFSISTPKELKKAAEKIRGHAFNPFLYRDLNLVLEEFEEDDSLVTQNPGSPEDFLDACILFLEEFGHHVWYLTLRFEFTDDEDVSSMKNIYSKILTCLSHVSNLRSLDIMEDFSDSNEDMSRKLIEQLTFPPLQYLEELKLIRDPGHNPFLNALLVNYCKDGGLKQLEFPGYFSEPVHKICTTNLSQLHVEETDLETYPIFQRISKTLDCSSLKKLKVELGSSITANLDHLFRIISPFAIEELELDYYDDASRVVWRPNPDAKVPILSSLKWFRFPDYKFINLEFLKTMPKLEHLDIEGPFPYGPRINVPVDLSPEGLKTFSTQLRCYVILDHVPENISIWEQLHELKVLAVKHKSFNLRFFREYGNKPFRNKLAK